MKQINFTYKKSCLIDDNDLEEVYKKLIPVIEKIKIEIENGYNTDYAFAHAPFDEQNLQIIENLVLKKNNLNPTVLVVIGIGGSNLGAVAVHEATNGKLYNENNNTKLKVYFADTVDTDYISDIYNLVEAQLILGNNIIINVISKTGTTIETVANFEIFLDLLKKYKPKNFNEFIVITTDKGSCLWNYANKIKCSILEVPKKIGGRYSVFTSAGLFPLAMLGINIKELLIGAKDVSNICLNKNLTQNFAVISASILYIHYNNGININDTFIFNIYLEAMGKWFRQLMGESIGKEFNIKEEKVEIGITPTVSIGSGDLHSVGQLYLAGPIDKFTTFLKIDNFKTNLKTPEFKDFEAIVPNIQNIKLSKIMDAIVNGVQAAYLEKTRPFGVLTLHDKSEYQLGQFMQLKMFEIVYLGHLFEINMFNQPNVELYKAATKAILKRS